MEFVLVLLVALWNVSRVRALSSSSASVWESVGGPVPSSSSLLPRVSPHDRGLRPGPPYEDLPPPSLIESPNKQYDPRPQDLNDTLLRSELGNLFDSNCMSVIRPKHLNRQMMNSNQSLINRKGWLVPPGEMPQFLRKMNFKYIRAGSNEGGGGGGGGSTRHRSRVSAKLKRKLQQFLWAFTACPVVYRWKDMGIRFWPRYLREGHCIQGKMSCSIPPGMKCRPSSKQHKTLLRWHCLSPHKNHYTASYTSGSSDISLGLQCQWIKISYPLITECSCSCPNGGNTYS